MAKKQLPAKGRSRRKGSRYERFVAFGIIAALIVISLILWGPFRTHRIGSEKPATQAKKQEPAAKKEELEKAAKPKPAEKPEKPGKKEVREAKKHEEPPVIKPSGKTALVALVIDDLGQDLKPAQEILSLPGRLTFAVMPGLPQSRKVAELARQNHRDVLIHLPMEYRGKNGKPAAGMLRSDMTPMDFLNTISDDVAAVPGAVGVNNHEGSSLTENREAMKFLMAELKARDLLFLDSLTSAKSVAYATAKEFGIKAAKRDVFIDNESDNADAIARQLDELARVAKEHGQAIGIGHPHPATIGALRKWLATTAQQGIEIVPVSKLMQ